jgi:hypothetical protein
LILVVSQVSLARGLLGLVLQVGARRLAGQQDHAVVADDHDVRVAVQVRIGLGDVDRDLGLDQRVVDGAADGAGAAVVVDGLLAGGAEEAAAAAHDQGQGKEAGEGQRTTTHSSLPNS